MKAVIVRQFTSFDQAEYGDLDDPKAGEGEVIVDVHAAEVNFPDILYIEGRYQARPPLPFSPGLGGAGVVSELGRGVSGLSVGQRVMFLPHYGAYAQKVRTAAGLCFPMPDALPFEAAAALGMVYQTAWFALMDRACFRPGARVLVLGATGGIGMAAMQLARAIGAGQVIAATRGAEGMAMARELGADTVLDSGMDNLRDGLRDAVMAATGGHGADIVIDPVGGLLSAAALRAMAWKGRLVVVGFASGEIPQFGGNYLLVKNISVSGIQWTDYRDRDLSGVRAAQDEIFRLWQEGRIAPRIAAALPLARFAEALADLRDARVAGKIILLPQVKE